VKSGPLPKGRTAVKLPCIKKENLQRNVELHIKEK
jgi:hypothetical protein